MGRLARRRANLPCLTDSEGWHVPVQAGMVLAVPRGKILTLKLMGVLFRWGLFPVVCSHCTCAAAYPVDAH